MSRIRRRTLLAAAALTLVASSALAQLPVQPSVGGGSARPVVEEPRQEAQVVKLDLRQRLAQLLKKGLWQPSNTPTVARPSIKKKAR